MAKGAKTVKAAGRRAGKTEQKVTLTLGELVAAAFDTVGSEVREVARVLSSRDMSRRLHCRIVCDA